MGVVWPTQSIDANVDWSFDRWLFKMTRVADTVTVENGARFQRLMDSKVVTRCKNDESTFGIGIRLV